MRLVPRQEAVSSDDDDDGNDDVDYAALAEEERAIMEDNGYKNGDDLTGKMFPTLFEAK